MKRLFFAIICFLLVGFSSAQKYYSKSQSDDRYNQISNNLDGYISVHAIIDSLLTGTYVKGDSVYKMTYIATLTPQPQNLLTHSEELDNSTFWYSDNTVTPNQALDVVGGNTMEMFTGGNEHSYVESVSKRLTVTENTTYYVSFDVKRGTSDNARWRVRSYIDYSWIVDVTSYYAQTSSSVQRITLSFTTPSGCTDVSINIADIDLDGTMYIGRVQVSTNPLAPYIKTTTTNVP